MRALRRSGTALLAAATSATSATSSAATARTGSAAATITTTTAVTSTTALSAAGVIGPSAVPRVHSRGAAGSPALSPYRADDGNESDHPNDHPEQDVFHTRLLVLVLPIGV